MLLRPLWSRLAAQPPVQRKPVCIRLSASLSHSSYEPKPRTVSSRPSPVRTSYIKPQQVHVGRASPAFTGFKTPGSSLLTDPGSLTKWRSGQKCFYSPDLVKSVLKSSLKPATVPGKRVPKGPRTKQPSRANQPSQDKVKVGQLIVGRTDLSVPEWLIRTVFHCRT